jgi:hypothetical protein
MDPIPRVITPWKKKQIFRRLLPGSPHHHQTGIQPGILWSGFRQDLI